MKQLVRVCGPKDKITKYPVLNVTTSGKKWRIFSPMLMGPVSLYGDIQATNVENAWQFSKVYEKHVDAGGNPSLEWFKWSLKGFHSSWAHRYPMGKGAKPLYSYYNNRKLNYIEARKEIYIPLYQKTMNATAYLDLLYTVQDLLKHNECVYLWDYDGYDNIAKNMTLEDVVNCEKYKMGHAFVLAMMLNGDVQINETL